MRSLPVVLTAPAQLEREHNENGSADRRCDAIDRAGKADYPGKQRNRSQESAVDKDLACCCGPSRDDRQHGDARACILLSAIERECPEVGWRPQEDDQEQDKWLEPYVSCARCPANHWWQC